ncbi:MAG: hypothetical protein JXL67_01035, partial [Calditrichaeota bacterium]|nr:hypothetical protein [Calditrichota bacterium]
NPDSYQYSTILLEAFVNTSNPFSYNEWALEALDSLKLRYGSRLVIAEYHRNTSQYSDALARPSVFEPLYTKYVENSSSTLKAVPDIFINGITYRVQGASSTGSVIERLNAAVSKIITQNNHFALEPENIDANSNSVSAGCKIARLGNLPAENLLLRLILIDRINNNELKRVVTDLQKSAIISQLAEGEITSVSFDTIPVNQKPERLIFSLTSSDELIVYQNIRVDL